jgi:2-dehydropantoate 2-reductase
MKITVVGAGAVGGYFGGRLQEAGADVTFLVREKRSTQLEKHGFAIESVNGGLTLPTVQKVTNVRDIPSSDLIILAVKGYHLEPIKAQIKPLVEKGAKVLPLLNGVEHYDTLSKAFGQESVIGGLCFIITTLDEKGHIVHTSKQHDIVFGELHKSQINVCQRFLTYAEKATINVNYSNDIMKDIWTKYAFITAYSGVTTASRLPIGPVRENEATLDLYRNAVAEMKELALSKGIDLGENFIAETINKTFALSDENTSSMHQDFRKGLPLEVESLQGGALRLAHENQLKLPHIETLYALLKPYEFPRN